MNTKLCKKCNQVKCVKEFTKHTKTYDGLYYCCRICKVTGRKRYPECPQKAKARHDRFVSKNPDYYNARARKWNAANPEKRKEIKRRYIESGLNKVHTQQRRARIRKLPHSFNKYDWKNALEHFNFSCAYCSNSERELQMEHFIPLSKNGHFTTYNIIPACYKCNYSKQDTDYSEWYTKREYFSADRLENILAWLEYHALRNGVKLSESMRDGA